MTENARNLDNLEILGGHPAVDYVNTVGAWNAAGGGDYLHDFDDFLRWNEMAGLLWTNAARRFRALPEEEKRAAFDEALKLRDSLHDILAARAANERLPQRALDHLNAIIRTTVQWRRIAADVASERKEICCVWDFAAPPAIAALGPIAWKAAELLELGELERLKECPGEHCGWLFLDTSKNRSRQWCSMKTCGNAAKVKRFRDRQSDAR